ncbi:MAG TPA: acylphosphatase, partial [Bacteroidetes bacterium]|nr:acylphosphatase [Bacteroidota bacterium]
MLNRKNLLLNVYGKVQGVFYRTSAVTVAIEFGVNGTVQNMR